MNGNQMRRICGVTGRDKRSAFLSCHLCSAPGYQVCDFVFKQVCLDPQLLTRQVIALPGGNVFIYLAFLFTADGRRMELIFLRPPCLSAFSSHRIGAGTTQGTQSINSRRSYYQITIVGFLRMPCSSRPYQTTYIRA